MPTIVTKEVITAKCPRCNLTFHPRTTHPRGCPNCGYRLDSATGSKRFGISTTGVHKGFDVKKETITFAKYWQGDPVKIRDETLALVNAYGKKYVGLRTMYAIASANPVLYPELSKRGRGSMIRRMHNVMVEAGCTRYNGCCSNRAAVFVVPWIAGSFDGISSTDGIEAGPE